MFDEECDGDKAYPVSFEIMVPTEPQDTWINGAANMGGIVLPTIRLRVNRTDTQ